MVELGSGVTLAKNTRDKASRTATLAAPYREILKTMVRERIKTEADKRELAAYLDRSVSFVNQLIYYGEGGMDAWIGTLTFTHGLKVSAFTALLKDNGALLRKVSATPRPEPEKAPVIYGEA